MPPYSSSMERVLAIPELLSLIFSYTDKETVATCACVCKAWSDVGLDSLWKSYEEDLLPLLSLLGPMEVVPDPKLVLIERLEYRDRIEPSDWKRFNTYARRVRSLNIALFSPTVHGLVEASQETLDELARTRQSLHILPNLKELHIRPMTDVSLQMITLFLHEGLTSLTLELTRLNLPDQLSRILAVFEEIAIRAPKLEYLDLRFNHSVALIEGVFQELIGQLHDLKKVVLPIYTVTSDIATSLSRLPHLGVIEFEFFESHGSGKVDDIRKGLSLVLEEGAFPALHNLAYSSTLRDVKRFFHMPFSPTNLVSLYILGVDIEAGDSLQDCLTLLSENCQLLTDLFLDLHIVDALHRRDELGDGTTQGDRISGQNLMPLTSFPNLKRIYLTHHRALDLSNEELATLVRKLGPSLQELSLVWEPSFGAVPELNMDVLPIIARHCPNLEVLSLCMDFEVTEVEDATTFTRRPLTTPTERFKALKEFSVGTSHIHDATEVALYLSQILPLSCLVSSRTTWTHEMIELIDPGMLTSQSIWAEVKANLTLLIKLRLDERAKYAHVVAENEDLKARLRIYEDINVVPDMGCIPH